MDQTTMSLREIVKTLKKRRSLILNITFGTIILAIVINFLIPPIYEAETNLRVKQSKGLANSLLTESVNSTQTIQQLMPTYIEILKSRTVVQLVIDKTQSGKQNVPRYEDMVKRITTQPVKDTEILKIKVKARSPEEAQLVANTLVETFTDRLTNLVRSEQAAVREFIGQRAQESRAELDKAETALEQYKRNEKVLVPTDETKAILERMNYFKKLVAENAVNSAVAQAKYNTAQQELSAEKPGFIADSSLIQQYKGKLADLEVELVGLSQNYGENHPRIQVLKASITETRQKLNDETARVINVEAPSLNPIHQGLLQSRIQAEAEIAAGMAQRGAIEQAMSQGEQELTSLPAKEQGFTRLMRDAMVAQEIYVMLAKRYEESRISEFMQPTDVQVIDVAVAPEQPVAQRKGINLLIGMMLGLFAGVGTAMFLEYYNCTIRNSYDAKQLLNLPVLGTVPDFNTDYEASRNRYLEKVQGFTSRMRRIIQHR